MSWLFKHYKVWEILPDDYPDQISTEAQLKFLLQYGVLAPSTFNAQPWACKINDNSVEVYLDKERLPTRSDQTGRFGYISLGCFIQNIEIAATYYGWQTNVAYHSESDQSRYVHIATIALTKSGIKGSNQELFKAIPVRSTNRSPRLSRPLPDGLDKQVSELLLPGISLAWLDTSKQEDLINLSHTADIAVWSDVEFRKEHVGWVRSNWTLKPDGMPGFGVGVGNIPSLLARPVIMSSKFAGMQAKKNEASLKQTASYLIFTAADGPAQWLDVGRSYEKIALYLASKGIALAPMGQFIEHIPTRQKLQELVSIQRSPQLFCRVGYPSQSVRHSPRRSVDQIII